MFAVILEVWPAEVQRDSYLQMAAVLRAELETMAGFLSIERFQSLTEPGKLLSLSKWRPRCLGNRPPRRSSAR